jgi:hypothetical protein
MANAMLQKHLDMGLEAQEGRWLDRYKGLRNLAYSKLFISVCDSQVA